MDHVSALSTKPLFETKSGSADTQREAAWLKRKKEFRRWQRGRCKSFTDSDLDELRACIELGFGFEFDSADLDPKLSSAFPALDFYCAVNKQFHCRSDSLHRSSSSATVVSSDPDTSPSSAGSSSSSLFEPGKKLRFKIYTEAKFLNPLSLLSKLIFKGCS